MPDLYAENGNFTGDVDVGGVLQGAGINGSYTPTITLGANAAAVTNVGVREYTRIGNQVRVRLDFNVTPTAGATLTQFTFPPPFASDFSAGSNATGGVDGIVSGSGVNGPVEAETTLDALRVSFISVGTGTNRVRGVVVYTIN